MRYWRSPSRAVVECLLALGASLLLPLQAVAQQVPPVPPGVITALKGQATVAHLTLTRHALNVGDEVFFQDRLGTDRDALLCILLGGYRHNIVE